MSAGLVSSEDSLLGLQMATYLLYPHIVFSLCACALISSYKDTNHTGLGPIPMTLSKLNYILMKFNNKLKYLIKKNRQKWKRNNDYHYTTSRMPKDWQS